MEENENMWKHFFQAMQTGDKGVETMHSFINRNCEFCDEISKTYKSKNILIVTHAANTRVINYYFNGKPKNYDFMMFLASTNSCNVELNFPSTQKCLV